MATIKSYTDISQSKKLAKVLPLESADMYYRTIINRTARTAEKPKLGSIITEWDIPCWSLAALIGVLPNGIVMNKDSQNGRYHFSSKYIGTSVTADNPVDACVDMIIRLNELNLL